MEEDNDSDLLSASDFSRFYLTEVFYRTAPKGQRRHKRRPLEKSTKHSGLFDMGNGYYLRVSPTDEAHDLSTFDIDCYEKTPDGRLTEGHCKFEEFDQPMRFSYKALQNYMAKVAKDPRHPQADVSLAQGADDPFVTPVVPYGPHLFKKPMPPEAEEKKRGHTAPGGRPSPFF